MAIRVCRSSAMCLGGTEPATDEGHLSEQEVGCTRLSSMWRVPMRQGLNDVLHMSVRPASVSPSFHSEKAFIWHPNEEHDTEMFFLNNLIARAKTCARNPQRHLNHPQSNTIHNNLFVDCDVGINPVAPSGQDFPREYFDVDYNFYMLMNPEAKVLELKQAAGTEKYKTLAEIREQESGLWVEGWETHGNDTAEVAVGYKEAGLPPRTDNINDRRIRTYDPSWFAPTSAQLNASNPNFPAEVERLLRHFDICIPIGQDDTTLPIGPHSATAEKCFLGIGSLDGEMTVPTSSPARALRGSG
ncbi:unnamed protein product [Vitrella brassicaformis CCMP3155]|uniref:Uncharacterized protein n=1 Tax=Vitrella brassicaformis (strain CCMP3155) TaxID=1169540 RepID=A0A0G4E9V9_VITBC|nr:unnamed protein product [Vitrella brassicaformis CCMP3155]|eukprot:CEL92437.1 unnamed protein product [Vitrella brassicaformis CCMP3155]